MSYPPAPAPVRPGMSTAAKIFLTLGVLVAMAFCAAGGALAALATDPDADAAITVVTPATLGGKSRVKLAGVTEHNGPTIVDATWGDFASGDLTIAVARAYTDPIASKRDEFTRSLAQVFSVKSVSPVAAGPLGGEAACGAGEQRGQPVIGCFWVDEGSGGYIVRTKVDAGTAASEFPALRAEIERKDQ